MSFRLFRLFLAAGLAAGLPTLLSAQVNNAAMQRALLKRQQQQAALQQQQGAIQQGGMQQAEILGTVQGVAKNGIVVVDGNNQTWRIAIVPITKVHVTGTTTAASLRSGLLVEFTAEIDSRGAVQKKVEALTVTSLSKEKQIGVFPAAAAAGGDAGGFGANAEEDTAGKSVKHAGRTAGKTGKTASKTQPAGSYRIVGKLIVGRGGALSVQPGRGMLPFELEDNAAIDVNVSDLSLIRIGNEVSVKAAVSPARPGMAQALELQVKLPEPQAGPPKDRPAKSGMKKSGKRAKVGEDEKLPETAPDKG